LYSRSVLTKLFITWILSGVLLSTWCQSRSRL